MDAMGKKKSLSRGGSMDSEDPPKRWPRKPKERWLLTRKTWRYMTDAGRKLIPEGVANRVEDVPKIEAHFQEVCRKEPKFLLWRKNSYPGALMMKKQKRRKGGSCRKASSVDEVATRPRDLPIFGVSGGRFDIQKMKYDFLNAPLAKESPRSFLKDKEIFPKDEKLDPIELKEAANPEAEEEVLVNMLEEYLKIDDQNPKADFDYHELVDKLQRYLSVQPTHIPKTTTRTQESFRGDHVQKSLSQTLSRYFSHSVSRDRIVQDLLTNRKDLKKLYFELRQTKGFKGRDYRTPQWEPTLKSYKPTPLLKRANPPPPLIEIQGESTEAITYSETSIQTDPLLEDELLKLEDEYRKAQAEEELEYKSGSRRRSSVDHDDVSQSVSDTIKRYLRMARKKSGDSEKADRFKRVNYDRNLRNIKAKGEITKPGDDDGLNKGCQTVEDWITNYRVYFDAISPLSTAPSSPTSPKGHHSFLSHLLHGKSHSSSHTHVLSQTQAQTQTQMQTQMQMQPQLQSQSQNPQQNSSSVNKCDGSGSAMQKSKSSSSVVHHGSRLMARTIFKRSKSSTRPPPQQACNWTPKGSCVWNSVGGKQVLLTDGNLSQLSDVERRVLQKVALAKIQALNLGVTVKIPPDSVPVSSSKKRRPYLLKRKALTTGIFDTSRKDASDKGASSGGLVFGIPLVQCVENDRSAKNALVSSRGDLRGSGGNVVGAGAEEARRTIGRTGSRASFSSLIETSGRIDDKGSMESLSRDRMAGSVPGLLDAISCSSTTDLAISGGVVADEEKVVPNLVTECVRHLEEFGLHTLGIFRVSPSKKRVRQLREDFDSGKDTSISTEQCPHDVATLLKEYLRDLPDPLLCRDLYNAFVQTQKIRNRRLQLEALQHLVQLLPSANRDTLLILLNFLSNVAKHSNDQTDAYGELVIGNKMNATNLATVFAPNVLHAVKHGSKEPERSEDSADVINVVRTMIDNSHGLFDVPAELLDEVYVHMMDTHPEALEELLNKRESSYADESQDEISDGSLWSPVRNHPDVSIEEALKKFEDEGISFKPKKVYSREECLHETAATGGPNVTMRIRHKERIRDRGLRKKRDESSGRESASSSSSVAAKLRDSFGYMAYSKTRSSSLESSSSLPADADIGKTVRISDEVDRAEKDRRKSTPYVLDKSGIITASLTIPVQSSLNVDDDIPFIEDGNVYEGKQQIGLVKSGVVRRRNRSTSGSDSSIASTAQTRSILVQQGYDSAVGSSLTHSSPPIGGSSADITCSSPPSWASTPPTSPDSQRTSVNYIPETNPSPALHRVTYTSAPEIQRTNNPTRKKSLDPAIPALSTGISSIGSAVLRSRTADFERITRTSTTTTTTTTTVSEKKKYTKRRYTDTRHPTRHIPDAESLESHRPPERTTTRASTPTATSSAIYKRRELISSVPSNK